MAWCTHHPAAETGRACARCARPFCDACLAELLGRPYCAACKELAVRELQRGRDRNPQAMAALVVSIIATVICSTVAPIVSSISLVMGLRALGESRRIRPGARYDMEWAAILISGATLACWVVGLAVAALVWLRG